MRWSRQWTLLTVLFSGLVVGWGLLQSGGMEPQAAAAVRLTARTSMAACLVALLSYSRPVSSLSRRSSTALLVSHLVHAGCVLWLAVATDGHNIIVRAQQPALVVVGTTAYVAIFLRAFKPESKLGHAGMFFVALLFFGSYAQRVLHGEWIYAPVAPLALAAMLVASRRASRHRKRPSQSKRHR